MFRKAISSSSLLLHVSASSTRICTRSRVSLQALSAKKRGVTLLRQQRRQYIFFPSSFAELLRSINDNWYDDKNDKDNNRKRTILVKLRNDNNEDTTTDDRHINNSRSAQFEKWLKKQRISHHKRRKYWKEQKVDIENMIQNKYQYYQAKHDMRRKRWKDKVVKYTSTSMVNMERLEQTMKYKYKSYKLNHDMRRQRWKEKLATTHHKIRNRNHQLKRRMNDLHKQYKLKLVTLTERSSPDWFTKEGLPLTSKDPLTGRFVNPWNSQSTDGTKSLYDLIRWRIQRMFNVLRENGLLFIIPRISLQLPFFTSSLNYTYKCNHINTNSNMLNNHLKKESTPSAQEMTKNNTIRLTWIGHSTTVVQMGFLFKEKAASLLSSSSSSFTMITDPMFSLRASPMQSIPLGVARFVQPSISISDLLSSTAVPNCMNPKIDICLISHDHYDHLDTTSCTALKDSVRLWLVPLGIKAFLNEHCEVPLHNIIELQWWDKVKIIKKKRQSEESSYKYDHAENDCSSYNGEGDSGDKNNVRIIAIDAEEEKDANDNSESILPTIMEVTCTPAQHWCSRSSFDRNKRLWCSWSVETYTNNNLEKSSSLKFFFGGDTGYPKDFPLYKQIGDKCGPYDLAAIPIGAYEPTYYMSESHINPFEAVQIHNDIRSRKSVGIHWGTFALTEEKHDEPPQLLQKAIAKVLGREMYQEGNDSNNNNEKLHNNFDKKECKYDDVNNTSFIDGEAYARKNTIDFVVVKHGECVDASSK